jgi:TRAP-type C4-dicarboxylate transport system permease small subunit
MSIDTATRKLASAFAVAGGILFCLTALLVLASILGRFIFLLPVPGDFEIVGMGTAISVFLCLPYCQLHRGNVTVDLFVAAMPRKAQLGFEILASCLYAVLALLFAWHMTQGFIDMFVQGDITVILGIPLWLAFPVAIASFLLLGICSLLIAFQDYRSMAQ